MLPMGIAGGYHRSTSRVKDARQHKIPHKARQVMDPHAKAPGRGATFPAAKRTRRCLTNRGMGLFGAFLTGIPEPVHAIGACKPLPP